MKRLFAILYVSAIASAGCTLPIAFYPAAAVGSGKAVEIVDEHGRLIKQDGLLVVNRRQDSYVPLGFNRHIRGAPSTQVVQVEAGKANIPAEFVLELVTVRSHEFVGMCLAAPFHAPQKPGSLLAPIGALIPQLQVYPDESLWLIPLVSGHHLELEKNGLQPTISLQNVWGILWQFGLPKSSPPLPDGPLQIVLRSDDGSMESSFAHGQYVLQRMRKRYQRQPDDNGPDLRLESFHFDRLHRYVTSEIRRLQSAASTSRPKVE